jgi:hypothetical protein
MFVAMTFYKFRKVGHGALGGYESFRIRINRNLKAYVCGSGMNAGLQNCARLLVSILEPGVARAQAGVASRSGRTTRGRA